jgi:hypothetical protein
MEAERTITINQPVAAVFPVVADGRRAALWRPSEAGYEVTAAEPGRLVSVRLPPAAGGAMVEGELELEAMGGGTILTYRLRAALGGWRRLVFGGTVRTALAAELAALDRLRDLLER